MKVRQAGFTLIEQIVVFSLAGILLPVIAGFFFRAFLSPVQESAALAASQDIRSASEWISQDLTVGPEGNNLGQSFSSPSPVFVTIGPSPGFSGNNSLTITYHTWPTPDNTTPDSHSIVYRLEQPDPSSDIQLMRRADDGTAAVIAQHIASPADVVFFGSAQSSPGGRASGITLNITSTVEGSTSTVTRQANFVFSVNRSFQPSAAPAPSTQDWNLAIPQYLAGNTGYWETVTTAGSGNISAYWLIASATPLQVWIYQGQPLGSPVGDSSLAPNAIVATVVANSSGSTGEISATTATAQPAGTYMVYLYNNSPDYVSTIIATTTYVSP